MFPHWNNIKLMTVAETLQQILANNFIDTQDPMQKDGDIIIGGTSKTRV
jgi:hypothetical protein